VASDDRPRAHILLVEDDPLLRDLASASLVASGYRISSAESRGIAMALLEDAELDLDMVVTDVSLRDGNGLDVASRFRERYPGRPVLLISGLAPGSHGRPSSEFAFLEKPFRTAELRTEVGRLLDRTVSDSRDGSR